MAGSLDVYRAKRDFGKTPEPKGETTVKTSDRPRFVIQKHAATRLHYDLRLEHEGVFLSWAVTKGPSLDPDEKRLAVEVEPHPLDYGDFEGTIPKGEYGGGTVMLWDRGWWEPEGDVEKALKKGHLVVRFDGKRMKGAWHLVRIKNDRARTKRTNWLMIKSHDGHAREGDADAFLEANGVSIASGRDMETIAAGKGRAPKPFMTEAKRKADAVWSSRKDPEATASAAAMHESASFAPKAARPAPRARRSTMPSFVEPQLCKLVDRPPSAAGWGHEIKFDGYRMQVRVENGRAALRTRKGLDWTDKFPEIAADASRLPDGVLDGEICALGPNDTPDFPGLQAAISDRRTAELVFFLFDALWLDGEDLRERPLRERKARLEAVLEGDRAPSPRLRFVDHFETAGSAILDSACKLDLEGVVSKSLDAPYRSGRSETWRKAKCRGGQEVVIGGWTTTGTNFRSLLAGVWRDGRFVYAGRIGTGFGAKVVGEILPRLRAVESPASPFDGPGAPKKTAEVHWVRPELVAEVQIGGWTGDGLLRQASFKGLREDKPAEEVTREAVDPAREPATKPKPARKASAVVEARPGVTAKANAVVMGVTITHPEKPLWKDEGLTKLDHVRYLETVGERMLPYVKGRPCSIIRAPDGVGGETFFQRHPGAWTSQLVTRVDVKDDKAAYVQFDTVEALIAAAQAGAIEFHPWNCAPGKPDVPGRFVFDLDPDEAIPFERVIEAAREVRDRLEDVGLIGFLKSTGGKGLHVVTPVTQPKTPIDWKTAKAFCAELCAQMAADSPDLYTTVLSKKARPGKIFLDYLRNDRTATAVSLLSARARPGATVSMPLAWTQARKGLDPKAYTIRTVPELLKKRDPWEAYADSARPLTAAIKALKG